MDRLAFWLLFAIVPIAFMPDWGNSYSEPKLAVMILLLSYALFNEILLFKKAIHIANRMQLIWTIFIATVLIAEIISLTYVGNRGLTYQSICLNLILITIPNLTANSNFQEKKLCLAMIPAIGILVISSLAMILFRIPIFSSYSPFGSSIGLKNSLSVYLAQTLPLLIIAIANIKNEPCCSKLSSCLKTLAYILLPLSIWVILANRTRSAWLMLLLYLASFLILYLKGRKSLLRIIKIYLVSLFIGLLLLNYVPNSLKWRSGTPYLDSLSNLASIKHSNGRIELWSVSKNLIKIFPWQSLGAGQAPAVWQSAIPTNTEVNPTIFAFLRPDLPLFNDYLQEAVEDGVLISVVFSFAVLGIPTLFFLYNKKLNLSDSQILLTLICLATSLDAFFDYPFNRPETTLIYAIALGLIMRPEKKLKHLKIIKVNGPIRFIVLGISTLTIILFLKLSIGLSARKLWLYTNDTAHLELAYNLWPWDSEWKNKHFEAFYRQEYSELNIEQYINTKLLAWPHDPESFLILAKNHEKNNNYLKAIEAYKQAVVKVQNGLCYYPAYNSYLQLIKKSDFPSGIDKISEYNVRSCKKL